MARWRGGRSLVCHYCHLVGGVDRVAVEASDAQPAGELPGRAGAAEEQRGDWCESAQGGALGLDVCGVERNEHDHRWRGRPGRLLDGGQRGIGAEEEDAPAVRAQDEPKGEEADVVLLAGRAGEQSQGSRATAPEPSQREQPPPDQVAGEMLLADLEAALLPTKPDDGERRQVRSRRQTSRARRPPARRPGRPERRLRRRTCGSRSTDAALASSIGQAIGRGRGLERHARRLGRG